MLRKIRIILALIVFSLITLLFLDFTGTIHSWFGWLAKIQFLPALLAMNFGVVAVLIIVTLLLGRVYCSIICPLGVMQDIISWFSGKRKGKKFRFSYSPAVKWLKYSVLVLFIITLVAGVGAVSSLFAPYSAYGRIVSNLFAPLWGWGNNLLACFSERIASYAFYDTSVWLKSIPTFIIAIVTFIAIAILAWRSGRTYCNTICPVGTILGFISKYSIFRPQIDTDKCNGCAVCSRKCKASCIDPKNHTIDYSRCVVCMDCLDNCKQGAISYRLRTKKQTPAKAEAPTINDGRRTFLTGLGIMATTSIISAQEKKVDGGLAVITKKKIPTRQTPIIPAGAQSFRHFTAHCTACQLCVSVCPSEVLRPSGNFMTLMKPEMSYERGYCRPECTKCSEVCPAGAINKITPAEKSSIQVGHAVWIKDNCVVLRDGVHCTNCARHCPAGAITMITLNEGQSDSPRIPAINTERCIGCGACENLCPARPFSAIYVEGHEVHRTI